MIFIINLPFMVYMFKYFDLSAIILIVWHKHIVTNITCWWSLLTYLLSILNIIVISECLSIIYLVLLKISLKSCFELLWGFFFFGGVCGEINTKSYKRNNLISLIIFPKMDITTLHVDNTVKSCLALLQEILPFG